MKLTLYSAISIDGFIAKSDKNSDWVSDVDAILFEKECKAKGCIILGRTTFEQFQGELYPMSDCLNIVMTTNPEKVKEEDSVIYTNKTPIEVLNMIESKGYSEALLIGGAETNNTFIDFIDEVIISIHPLLLGQGLNIFGNSVQKEINLTRISTAELDEGLVQIKYRVEKSN